MDREIAKVESTIAKLKKKQQDLEEAAKRPPAEHPELRTQGSRPKNQSIAQVIYADNRRKAAEAHKMLAQLGPPVDLPLYHQPSDTAVFSANRAQFQAFRPRLLKFLRRRQKEKEARHRYLTDTYNKYMSEWIKRINDIEKANSAQANAAAQAASAASAVTANAAASVPSSAPPTVAPNVSIDNALCTRRLSNSCFQLQQSVAVMTKKKEREFYEKVFPELRKQREDRERFSRVGSRIKSDADMEEIMDGLQEQEVSVAPVMSFQC